MERSRLAPRTHVFVCTNRREADSSLGPGCGQPGDELYAALKKEVAARRQHVAVWITRTACMGLCPPQGCSAAVFSGGVGSYHVQVLPEEASRLLAHAEELGAANDEAALVALERHQAAKVLEMGRRLRPQLTHEDLLNREDFPELADRDWNFEDGILAGVRAALTALRAR